MSSNKMKLRKSNDSDSESSNEEEWESETDSTYEPPKKHRKHEENEEEDIEETEDDNSDDEDSDDDDDDDEEDGPSISRGEIQKLVSKIFPSKYMNKRAKSTDKLEKNTRIKLATKSTVQQRKPIRNHAN